MCKLYSSLMVSFIYIVFLSKAIVWAQDNNTVQELTEQEVLTQSAVHFPKILEILAKRQIAANGVVAADGAFDLVFSADGFDRVSGFWTGQIINTQVKRNLRSFGANIYGGYRRSNGTFPIYEDINFTNRAGEFKVGALFSLLQDRNIDQRRFNVRDAKLALQQADFEVALTKIGVQHKALIAYWRWVASGQQLKVYEELYEIAQNRQTALEKQVRAGARAQILLTENLQNIYRRERLVKQSQRQFLLAANDLSFYYRGVDGTPIIPARELIPRDGERILLLAGPSASTVNIPEILNQRPELQILKTGLERARQKISLSKNNLKPRLDLNVEVSRDFGDIAEGGISRDSTDTIIGFRFSVPLQQREAKGKLNQAVAQRQALSQQRRSLQDQIEIELRNILIDIQTSEQLIEIANREFDQSLVMQQADQKRFIAGGTDFFILNNREEIAADARIRLLLAGLDNHIASANYYAATIDYQRLQIDTINGF